MNNLEDSLKDLLSDTSTDNDSFFESQPGQKKGGGSKASTTTTPGTTSTRPTLTIKIPGSKGKMEDLFGIKEEESKTQYKPPPIRSTLAGGTKAEKPLAMSTPKAKAKTEENDDIISDLGFDPKKPKSAITNKANLFDDILGPMESRKSNPTTKTDEQTVRRDDAPSTRGTISRQSTETTENSGTLLPNRPRTSSGRRSSITSPAKHNPLDLFASKERESSRVPTPKARRALATVDWLGLGSDAGGAEHTKPEEKKRAETPPLRAEQSIEKLEEPATTDPMIVQTANQIPFLMTSSNIGTQNAVNLIKQQESQIALAAQMKNQEATLLEMQQRQHDLLTRQEAQFNELLQKQMTRQNQLEQNIKAQQDRINAHIQFLISQPLNLAFPTKDEEKPSDPSVKATELIQLEADVKRLELEKLRLEDLVSNINANYDKEIAMMEKSFRKQIQVLEEHLSSIESRLQGEIETLHKFYTEKLRSAEENKQEIKSRLETDLVSLKEGHDEEIRRLKKAQDDDLDTLREDHRRMLEAIRQSKLLEFAVVQENGSYLETLRMASNNLESVSGDLQSLRTEMERKLDILHREKETQLEVREKKVEDSEKRLKMVETVAEEEKVRLMNLVASLESQLTRLSKDSSEENWIMRQKMASLEAEKLTFEKEKSLAREQIAKDEKRIEELKEYQLSETQRQMQLIQEERTQLNVEKAKLETAKKLESSTDTGRSRLEIEASLKVAQDAARQAENERERFFKLQRQLESQKRELIEKENMLRTKEEELEQDVALARTNERKAHEAAQRARLSEQSFNEKIIFLQQKMRDISEKETRLSQERLTLSQERIELKNMKSKLELNRCSLCRVGERNAELSQVLRPMDGNNGIPVIDDHQYSVMQTTSAVDRLLDETIVESLERMKENSTSRRWNDLGITSSDTTRPNGNVETDPDFSKYDPTSDFLRNL